MTLRVLHAPSLAAGNPARLAQAERELGLASWCVTTDPNSYGYPVDEQLADVSEGRLRFEWQRWKLLARVMCDFDVVHFNFGRTLFPNAWQVDLPVLKAAGKAVFMTFQGDDARQGDYCRANFAVTFASRVPDGYYTPASDAAKRRRIAQIARYVDGIYALNPDLLHVLPGQAQFLPYANVDLKAWRPPMSRGNAVPVVVHAPTHRLVKGTDVILQSAERLRAAGESFELVLIENLNHEEARRAFERADLAIDQLFAGWYGGFAVELMALGTPVISYLRDSDLGYLPAEMRTEIPIIHADPHTLDDVLRSWLRAPPERLRERGSRSRAYVERWHDPLKIAARLKQDYEAAFAASRAGRARATGLGGRR